MAKYYLVEERDNGAGCLTALVVGIIVIVALAYFAMYALAIALGIVLIVSALYGTIITLKNGFVALGASIPVYAHVNKPNGWILPTFVYRWVMIVWETIRGAWVYNGANIKDCFTKAGAHRFLSFKKWINLFSALSILVFGALLTLLIVVLHVYLFTVVLRLVIAAVVLASVIFGLIGLGISVAYSTTNYLSRLRESYYNSATIFSAYVTQQGYKEFWQVIKNYWCENVNYLKDGIATFKTLPLLSFKKWLKLWTGIMLMIIGTLLLVVYAILHLLVISILFVVFKIISLFKR